MLSIMSGNWTPVQNVHPTLKTYLFHDILKGDVSPARLDRLSEEVAESLKDTFSEKNLPDVCLHTSLTSSCHVFAFVLMTLSTYLNTCDRILMSWLCVKRVDHVDRT